MNKNVKVNGKIQVLLCVLMMLLLAACGKSDPAEDKKDTVTSNSDNGSSDTSLGLSDPSDDGNDPGDNNGTAAEPTELELETYKLVIDGSYKPTIGKYSDDYTKYYKKNNDEDNSLVVQFTYTNHASHDAAVKFLEDNFAATYEISSEGINTDKIDNDRYYLYWSGQNDGKDMVCGVYVLFTEDTQLSIYEIYTADAVIGPDELRAEIEGVAGSAVYTGEKKEQPKFSAVANNDFRVTVAEGFDSPQLQEAASMDPSTDTVITDSKMIVVYYKEADTFDRGDSYFKITPMGDQTGDIAEIAKSKATPKDSNNSKLGKELTEATFGEIWPDLTDSAIRDTKIYKLSIIIDDNPFAADTYYFNINGRNYSAAVLYPRDDETARRELLDQFYQVEFIYKGAAE